MKHLLESHPGVDQVYLLVAQGGLYDRPTLVQTVLGSCVSVVFFSREHLLGGIFHALLPTAAAYETVLPPQNPFRYVDSSIDALAARLARRGVAASEVECKVFGGASALFQGEAGVGELNVRAAFESLARHRFRVAASHVGGEKGRKLVFLSHTGEVFVKLLGSRSTAGDRRASRP